MRHLIKNKEFNITENELYKFLYSIDKSWSIFARSLVGCAGWYVNPTKEVDRSVYFTQWIFKTAGGYIYFTEFNGKYKFVDSLIKTDLS